jgi:hypothetical protein
MLNAQRKKFSDETIRKVLLEHNSLEFIEEYGLFNIYSVLDKPEEKKGQICRTCKIFKPYGEYARLRHNYVVLDCKPCKSIFNKQRRMERRMERKRNQS